MYEYGRRPLYKKKKKQRYQNCSEYLSQHLPIAIPEPPPCRRDCTNLGCVSLGGCPTAAAIGTFLSRPPPKKSSRSGMEIFPAQTPARRGVGIVTWRYDHELRLEGCAV
jgi:hypothetical protein